MPLCLYFHPFSSYSQKVLTALGENETPFTARNLEEEDAKRDLREHWPINKFPILVDAGRVVAESSIIIEYLDRHHRGTTRFIPDNKSSALEVRFLDRFFDNHVMAVIQRPVSEALRKAPDRLNEARKEAEDKLETAYAWLEKRLEGRAWAAGTEFSLADCAAAPALFYADWVHRVGDGYPNVRRYRAQLLERPSFAKVVEGGRPYRTYFPLGAPDRD